MILPVRAFCTMACLFLSGCVPWTIRPIEPTETRKTADALSPAAYVDSIWSSKLIPAMQARAVDAGEVLKSLGALDAKEKTSAFQVVKGTGVVLKIDTASRIGVAHVDVAPFDRQADLTIQIGPVMRGVALRDATGLFPFASFANQIQYADVANELNAHAMRALQGKLDTNTPQGTRITFLGALEIERGVTPPMRWLVPVQVATGAAK